MKVLEVTGIKPYKLGGFERVCIEFSKYLQNKGYEHILFFNGEPCRELRDELNGLDVAFYNRKFQNIGIKDALFLARFILSKNINIVHLHFCGKPYNMFTLIGALLPCKIYLTYHMALRPSSEPVMLKVIKKIRNRIMGVGVARFVCVSEYSKKSFMDTYYERDNKVVVIHNGLSIEDFPARERSCIRKDAYRVICVASLTKQKGVEDLLQAVSIVSKVIPFIELTIIGTGPQEHELREQVRQLGIGSCTRFLGVRSDVPQMLSKSDVAVVPSRYDEAFGFSVIEAMAVGLPIITTDTGGVPEIVDANTGTLVPANSPAEMADALVELYHDYEKGLLLAEHGRKRVVDKFSSNMMFENHMNLYMADL